MFKFMKSKLNEEKINTIKKCLEKKADSIKIYVRLINSDVVDFKYIEDYKKYYTMYASRRLNDDNFFNEYFKYLNELKQIRDNKSITFEEVLINITKRIKANFVSPSYASKLLATINPDKPVWDKNVLIQLDDCD